VAATDPASAVVICDAGPIIHLHELQSISLLADFTDVLVPEAVWNEVELHAPDALISAEVQFKKHPNAASLAREIEELGRVVTLHRGELEALQLA
jgi:predicted nucleic acid-binding protein